YNEAHRVFKVSFVLMLGLGVVASSVLFFWAKPIVEMLGNPGAYYAMVAIAPALLFVPIMAVFRGYFQGLQQMEPTAISQLVEQAVRVIVGLVLAVVLLSKGLEIAAAGASFGTSVGPIAGVLVLVVIYYIKRKKLLPNIMESRDVPKESSGHLLGTLAKIAIPITIGVSILPIMNIADVVIVMTKMQATGFTESQANALYGQLTGLAGPVINIPMALALSIALSIVPAIAAAKSINDTAFLDVNIKLGLRMAMVIGVPCTFGLMSLAKPIMLLLYPLQAESATSAAPCLFILAIGVTFLAVAQTMAGVLQGLGRPYVPVRSLMVGLVVKCVATYFLVGIPHLNVQGAAIGSAVAYGVIGIMNFMAVKRYTNTKFDLKLSVLKPVISGAVMCVCVLAAYYAFVGIIGNSLAAVIAICVGGLVYGMMLLKTKSIETNEIKLLPKGDKIIKLLEKLRLV
ncbi:MAG: polysaccharide biosynthesis protein, partial [Anaerovorax sp.]